MKAQEFPIEFKNGGFTLKTHQMFFVHATPEESKKATITGHYFGLVFEENSVSDDHDYYDAIVCEKFRFENVFGQHENSKPSFSNFYGSKSVFEKLGFRD